jgi:mRNA-degrading endonuclease HigB of HigAB toxin-antitoxin module
MEKRLLEPLKYYEQTARQAHEENLKSYFDELVVKSGIDVQENRKTAAQYRKKAKIAENTLNKIGKLKFWRVMLILLIIAGFIMLVVSLTNLSETESVILPLISVAVIIAGFLLIFLYLNKKIKKATQLYSTQKAKADSVLSQAEKQMQALNSLFTEKDTFDLIEKVMPNLNFSDDYSLELSTDFKNNYGFIDDLDDNRSVINTVSGRLNKNPFMFLRYVNHYMGTKDYHGMRVITYRTVERDSKGRMRSVVRTQTLHAMVVKPFPQYSVNTALNYGNQIAPSLNFSRKATHVEKLSEKKLKRKIKSGAKDLKNRAEKEVKNGGQFTEMTNTDFDVMFGAFDRDHEVQFRVMFTPLAQINMVKLLRSKTGYGDDFSFIKRGRHNYIVSEHAQKWNMDTSPENYFSYDVDIARNNFINFNNEYFKSLYFDLAPLLTIPAYNEEPSMVFEPIKNVEKQYSDYEHEVMANVIGSQNFAHPSSVTEVILKSKYLYSDNHTDCVEIMGHSYTGVDRVDVIPVLGGDGRMHGVPVPWVEYIPVKKTTRIAVKRIGLKRKEFASNVKKASVAKSLYDSPYGYYHGLFAKIVDNTDLNYVETILEKIKPTKKEN